MGKSKSVSGSHGLVDYCATGLLVVSLGALLSAHALAYRVGSARNTCAGNLQSIGQATVLYVSDFDGLFPPAYSSVQNPQWTVLNWSWRLEPYLQAGASNAQPKNSGYDTQLGRIGKIDFGWSDSGGSLWHCPDDRDGSNVSYGTNPMISGADERLDENVRVPSWRSSKTIAEIPSPEATLWAGDTNKQWHEDAGRYYEVFADWMRDRDLPKTDGRALTRPEVVEWYRAYLKEDNTDIRSECIRPGGWGCKGPAYRHGRHGVGTGSAGMVFCDGHARMMPYGSITVERVFPELGGGRR